MCLFEGTVVSLGRGTDAPFEIYGHPDMKGRDFSFTPQPNAGSSAPPHKGRLCYGVDLREVPDEEILSEGLTLRYVIDAYRDLDMGERFFTPMFEKLVGVDWVRRMIVDGASADEIEARWRSDAERFERQRAPYLLYEDWKRGKRGFPAGRFGLFAEEEVLYRKLDTSILLAVRQTIARSGIVAAGGRSVGTEHCRSIHRSLFGCREAFARS